MQTVLIEDVSKNPAEWGVSITSSNPLPMDYFVCEDKNHALKLSKLLTSVKRRLYLTAFGALSIVFCLGFGIGAVVFNGLCGGG